MMMQKELTQLTFCTRDSRLMYCLAYNHAIITNDDIVKF